MADSLLARIKKLEEEKLSLIEGAKKEALAKVTEGLEELTSLGFHYKIVEADKIPGPRKAPRKISDGPCPICKFATEPPHDARRHRSQGDKKQPFTPGELKEMNLTKI